MSWLERAGIQRICLVDNASTYEPLLQWYARSPHLVVRLQDNFGQLAPWISGAIDTHAFGESYVVTDPDLVPDKRAPLDAIDHFSRVLDAYPDVLKVGFGLRIDNLPRHYRLRRKVQAWESQFWRDPLISPTGIPTALYRAPIDTTFALYRERCSPTMGPALRTGWPYVARHMPWYANTRRPTREELYYTAGARPDVTSWQGDRLPAWLESWIRGEVAPGVSAEEAGKQAQRRLERLARQGRGLGRPPARR